MKSSFKIVATLVVMAAVASVMVIGCQDKNGSSGDEPIVWYGMMPHPYITEVEQGVKACEKDLNIKILKVVGQEWTQDNENNNIKALSTKNHKAFSVYPGDPGGANGLFKQLKDHGQIVVAYGAEPKTPTPAAFTVATDIKGAAMVAAEALVKMMGEKGNILNVLETVTDINTTKRDEGIREVVAKYPNVKIYNTISDMSQVSVAKEKIDGALAAGAKDIDGIITTGYNPTIAAAAILTEWHKNASHKRIRYIGIDTGPTVIKAIRDGSIDATVAQNPFGHGYISTLILKLMLDGWKPVKPYQFINAGIVVITKDNVDTYAQEVQKITDGIVAELKTKYLTAPVPAATQPAK